MKKKFIILVLVNLLFFSLANCSSTSSLPPEHSVIATGSMEDKNLVFSIWDANQATIMNELALSFLEKYPYYSIDVKITPWEEYWTKLDAEVSASQMPDIFWMHPNEFPKYAANNFLLPLDNIISIEEKSHFHEKTLASATYNDTLYGVPKDFDTIALAYNKDLFDEYNVDYPDQYWTWNDFLFAARKLTVPEKDQWGFLATLDDQIGYLPWIYQSGGFVIRDTKVGIANPETQEGIEFFVNIFTEENISPPIDSLSKNQSYDIFQNGKVAMTFIGSWQLNQYANNTHIQNSFDITVLPKGKERATIFNSLSYATGTNSEHSELVAPFLKYLASETAHKQHSTHGIAISASKHSDSLWLSCYPNYNASVFVEMLEYAQPIPTSSSRSIWGEYLSETVGRMIDNDISVNEGTKLVEAEMIRLIENENCS